MTVSAPQRSTLQSQAEAFADKVKALEAIDEQDQAHFEKIRASLQKTHLILDEMRASYQALQEKKKALYKKTRDTNYNFEEACTQIEEVCKAFFAAKKRLDEQMSAFEASDRALLEFCKLPIKKG